MLPRLQSGEGSYGEGHRQRLRERFEKSGFQGFHDYEVLELLLTFSIPRQDVKPLAKALLARFGSLPAVLDAEPSDLEKVPGLGRRSSGFLRIVRSLISRYFEETLKETDVLQSPEAVVDYCRAALQGERNEVFEVLYLSSKNRVIGVERLFEGTLDRTAVYPRRIIEGALKANAAALIFVHNHPSGDPTPSPEDCRLTKEIASAAGPLGISVHDHIIIGRGRHLSLRKAGKL